jgi:hypothetical protein
MLYPKSESVHCCGHVPQSYGQLEQVSFPVQNWSLLHTGQTPQSPTQLLQVSAPVHLASPQTSVIFSVMHAPSWQPKGQVKTVCPPTMLP